MPLIVETHRSGVFTFQVGLDLTRLQPLIDKINYGHRLFSSLPLLPDIASQLEKETLLSSIHGTDTIEGGTLTEDEILQVIESIPEITQEEHKCRISNLAQAYRFAEIAAIQARENGQPGFMVSETFVLSLHQLISKGINESAIALGNTAIIPRVK